MDDIEDRLRSHAQAFDGLLSLIPAKYYYGDDGSDQWKRKKQTKEEAREAKRAKLDPDSAKTAKDVMDESARKRKRDEDEAGSDEESSSDVDVDLNGEKPMEGMKRGDAVKKQKADGEEKQGKSPEEIEARKKQREEKKAQKKAAQKEKKKAKDAAKKEKQQEEQNKAPQQNGAKSDETKNKEQKPEPKKQANDDDDGSDDEEHATEGLSLEFNEQPEQPSTASSTSGSSASNPQSGSSSISSIAPPATESAKQESSEPKPLKPTPEELKQRLQKRLDELRAARHADGLNGKPARNRQELIEARRQKAEQRKAHKKLLRQKAKEEEQQKNDEALARRFSPGGSGSLLASPRSPAESTGSNNNANYAFGRVVFADGHQADPTLTSIRDKPKKHGAQDPATALRAAESKKTRLAEMDEAKRAEIEQKDMWLNAKKRAHGERVRDDTSLLKKALKRKESAKRKSEREWKERLDAVKRSQETKQQKRDENLRKRREEKGGNKGKKNTGGSKKKARPGFEGSFKAKVGGKKK